MKLITATTARDASASASASASTASSDRETTDCNVESLSPALISGLTTARQR